MIIDKLSDFFSRHSTGLLLGMCLLLVLYILLRKPRVVVEKDPSVMAQLSQYRDENGRLHGVIQQQELDKAEMKSYIDSLAGVLRIKPRFIKGQDKFTIVTDTVFQNIPVIEVRNKDTLYKLEKRDWWLDLVAIAGRDTGSIKLSIRDTLTRIEVVRNPLIGRTERKVFLSASSPYNKIMQGSSFTVREPRTWLTIGPSVQYNPFNSKVTVGVSAQIPIIKLRR